MAAAHQEQGSRGWRGCIEQKSTSFVLFVMRAACAAYHGTRNTLHARFAWNQRLWLAFEGISAIRCASATAARREVTPSLA